VYNSGEQPAEQWHGRTVREDDEGYIAFMAKPDVRTALRNLAAAFTLMKTTRTARWDITPRGNIDGSGHR
jgi:putative transposase